MVDDFIRGQKDCRDGEPAKLEQSEHYYNGYSAQYQLDEINTYTSLQRSGENGS